MPRRSGRGRECTPSLSRAQHLCRPGESNKKRRICRTSSGLGSPSVRLPPTPSLARRLWNAGATAGAARWTSSAAERQSSPPPAPEREPPPAVAAVPAATEPRPHPSSQTMYGTAPFQECVSPPAETATPVLGSRGQASAFLCVGHGFSV